MRYCNSYQTTEMAIKWHMGGNIYHVEILDKGMVYLLVRMEWEGVRFNTDTQNGM